MSTNNTTQHNYADVGWGKKCDRPTDKGILGEGYRDAMIEFSRYVLFGCHQLTELGDVQEM